MNDNFDSPGMHAGFRACGEDPDDGAGDDSSGWERLGTEHAVRHVIAGCIATPLAVPERPGRQVIEFELVTTEAGLRYRERLPTHPADSSWIYSARENLAAYYLKTRADFIAEGTWQMTDTTRADDLLVAMARNERKGRA